MWDYTLKFGEERMILYTHETEQKSVVTANVLNVCLSEHPDFLSFYKNYVTGAAYCQFMDLLFPGVCYPFVLCMLCRIYLVLV